MEGDMAPLECLTEDKVVNEQDVGNKSDMEVEQQSDKRLDEEIVNAPKAGMTFSSLDSLFVYYKTYAKQHGFDVIKRSRSLSSSGKLEHITIACSRVGKAQSTKRNVLDPKPVSKSGCKARVNATIYDGGGCKVNSVKLAHNHVLIPSKSRFCLCNRELSVGEQQVELPKSQSSVFQGADYESVPFLEKDDSNFDDKGMRLRFGVGDVEAMNDFFVWMQARDSNFFYLIDIDKHSQTKNIFWADARSRAAYEEFGDVVLFDSTYLTNKYELPLTLFLGVNHHGQPILLGCGLLSNEDTSTFLWLFRAWLSCMSGHSPNAIITDENKAMQNAIEIVFPKTQHRWCLWHVMKKLPEKLRGHKLLTQIKTALQNVVYDSLTIAELEDNWGTFVTKFDLCNNAWLSGLFENRHRWVPAFVKDAFWAGMSTLQRNENMNAFFDGYVNSKTTLKQFIEQYDSALKSKVEKEKQADFQSSNSLIPCVTHFDMESQFQKVYTIAKFKEFQQEVIAKLYCEVSFVENRGRETEHDVSEYIVFGEEEERYHKHTHFKVYMIEEDCKAECSCRLFEHRGILCRHIISVFIKNKIFTVSPKYILARWRKDLRRRHTMVKVSYDDWSNNPKAQRYQYLLKKFEDAAEVAVESDTYCSMLWSRIDGFLTEAKITDACGSSQVTTTSLCEG